MKNRFQVDLSTNDIDYYSLANYNNRRYTVLFDETLISFKYTQYKINKTFKAIQRCIISLTFTHVNIL